LQERPLRYSERKRIAETGDLGDLLHDAVPVPLRHAVLNLITRQGATSWFSYNLRNACAEYFGWPSQTQVAVFLLQVSEPEPFLDFVEIAITQHTSDTRDISDQGFNYLFQRHRFGYRVERGDVRKVGSPALEEVVVGPALLAVQRPGWEEVERSFKEAISHQRGGADERDDAITAANAAVEAALKAAGFKGANLGPLAKDFARSDLVPAQLRGVPEALETLLQKQGAIRHEHGDAHGKAPGAEQVPEALADLAVHWAGAFIVYLASVSAVR